MLKQIMAALSLIVVGSVNASGFDISFGDEAASFTYLTDISSLDQGNADIGFGVFFNENDDNILNAHFLVAGRPATADQPWQFGVGSKVYIGSHDNPNLDLGAITIGGQLRYIIPNPLSSMAITLEGYFAPSIGSFGDTDNLTEIVLRHEFEIVPSTRAYVGYRRIEVDFDTLGDVEFDKQVHAGIRIGF